MGFNDLPCKTSKLTPLPLVAAVVMTITILGSCQSLPPRSVDFQYEVKIVRGDTGWTKHEIEHLAWALGRLTPPELAVLRGYEFKRWISRESRARVDPTYAPMNRECGRHEVDFDSGKAQISIYDGCISDECWHKNCFYPDKPIPGWLMSRFNILHEIGHAMAIAEARDKYHRARKMLVEYREAVDEVSKAINEYNKASVEANKLIEEWNAGHVDARGELEPRVKRSIEMAKNLYQKADDLDRKTKALEKELRHAQKEALDAKERALREFVELIEGKEPLTGYSMISKDEAFAEAFAIFKVYPQHIKKVNARLHEWFERYGYLKALKPESAGAEEGSD